MPGHQSHSALPLEGGGEPELQSDAPADGALPPRSGVPPEGNAGLGWDALLHPPRSQQDVHIQSFVLSHHGSTWVRAYRPRRFPIDD